MKFCGFCGLPSPETDFCQDCKPEWLDKIKVNQRLDIFFFKATTITAEIDPRLSALFRRALILEQWLVAEEILLLMVRKVKKHGYSNHVNRAAVFEIYADFLKLLNRNKEAERMDFRARLLLNGPKKSAPKFMDRASNQVRLRMVKNFSVRPSADPRYWREVEFFLKNRQKQHRLRLILILSAVIFFFFYFYGFQISLILSFVVIGFWVMWILKRYFLKSLDQGRKL
jgi:hypothetical protein